MVIDDDGSAPHIRYGHRVQSASWSERRRRHGRSQVPRHGHDEAIDGQRRASCGCARATTATAPATRRVDRDEDNSRAGVIHPQTWPASSTSRASACRNRVGPQPPRSSRHHGRLRARDDAAALADVLLHRCDQRRSSWPTNLGTWLVPEGGGSTRSCAERWCATGG